MRRGLLVVLIGLAGALPTGSVRAADGSVEILSDKHGVIGPYDLASTGSSRALAVWSAYGPNGSIDRLEAADFHQGSWGQRVRLSSPRRRRVEINSPPRVTGLGRGRGLVVWQEDAAPFTPAHSSVFAAFFDGKRWRPALRLADAATTISVARLGDGVALAAWCDVARAGKDTNLEGARIELGNLAREFRVDGAACGGPLQIAPIGPNAAVVVWQAQLTVNEPLSVDLRGERDEYVIRAVSLYADHHSDAMTISNPEPVNGSFDPQAASLGEQRAAAWWFYNRSMVAATFESGRWSPPLEIDSGAAVVVGGPSAVTGLRATVVALWNARTPGNGFESRAAAFDGARWSRYVALPGSAVLTAHGLIAFEDGRKHEIYVARPTANSWTPPALLTRRAEWAQGPDVAEIRPGLAVVMWEARVKGSRTARATLVRYVPRESTLPPGLPPLELPVSPRTTG